MCNKTELKEQLEWWEWIQNVPKIQNHFLRPAVVNENTNLKILRIVWRRVLSTPSHAQSVRATSIWTVILQKSEEFLDINRGCQILSFWSLVWTLISESMSKNACVDCLRYLQSVILRCVWGCPKFWNSVAECIPEWKSQVQKHFFPAASLVAWAFAMRCSFPCCIVGHCLVALYDWWPRDMLCSWQHPVTMLPAGGVIR